MFREISAKSGIFQNAAKFCIFPRNMLCPTYNVLGAFGASIRAPAALVWLFIIYPTDVCPTWWPPCRIWVALWRHSHYDLSRGRGYGARSPRSDYDVILIVTSFATEHANRYGDTYVTDTLLRLI